MSTLSFDSTRLAIQNGEVTCEKVTEDFLREIDRGNELNAFLSLRREQAIEEAVRVDRKLAEGKAGSLAGMVVAVKDILSVKGEKVTCGSRMLEKFTGLYDATVVRKLRSEDAIVIGKTNMDEFAMGSSSEFSAFGPVLNPLDHGRVPGGSSSGSAVAVAAGMAHTAIGTDTGGSIRQPAAFCGIVGLKPTYGRVSRYGLVALSSSFDQVGPFAHTVTDAARVLRVIAGDDEHDSTTSRLPVPDYTAALTGDVQGLRVGLPGEFLGEGLDESVRSAVGKAADVLKEAGADIVNITLPHAPYHISAYYILMTAEASSNLARYDGARYGFRSAHGKTLEEMYVMSRSESLGPEVKRRIMLGTYVLSAGYYEAYYRKAQRVRRLIQNDFLNAYRSVDCIVMPASPTTAFRFGEKADNPLRMYLSDVFTVSANLAGIPAISVPFGADSRGLPVGIQVAGKHFDEPTILRVADVLQSATSSRPRLKITDITDSVEPE